MEALLIALVLILLGIAVVAGLMLAGVIPNPFAKAVPTKPMGQLLGPGVIAGAQKISLANFEKSEPIRIRDLTASNDGSSSLISGIQKGSVLPPIPSGYKTFTYYTIGYKTQASSSDPPSLNLYVDDKPVDSFPINPVAGSVNTKDRTGPFTASQGFDVRLTAPTKGMSGSVTDVTITFYK